MAIDNLLYGRQLGDTQTPSPMSLTRQQIQIILLVSEGMSRNEIAEQLSLRPYTVDNHRKMALKRSGYRNWCHFMAETGMSGELQRWRELRDIRSGCYFEPSEEEDDEESQAN